MIAQDQETVRVRSPLGARDPRFIAYVASLVGAPVTDGDAYQMLENGDAIFPADAEAIDKAQHRISFESFIYSDGEIARAVHRGADRRGAARRHGPHRPRLDRLDGSVEGDVKELTDAGIQVVWFNPLASWSIEEVNYRTHRKVLVVDGDRRLHRRRRRRRSLAWQRRSDEGSGATRSSA